MVGLPFGLIEHRRTSVHIVDKVLDETVRGRMAGPEGFKEEVTRPFIPRVEIERVCRP